MIGKVGNKKAGKKRQSKSGEKEKWDRIWKQKWMKIDVDNREGKVEEKKDCGKGGQQRWEWEF